MIETESDRRFNPPDYEDQAVFHCSDCDVVILDGESYYRIEGRKYCEDCLNDNFREIAEKQEFQEE